MYGVPLPATAYPASASGLYSNPTLPPSRVSTGCFSHHTVLISAAPLQQRQQHLMRLVSTAAVAPDSDKAWTGSRTLKRTAVATASARPETAAAAPNGKTAETAGSSAVSPAPRVHPGLRPRPRSITSRRPTTSKTTGSSSSNSSMDEASDPPPSFPQQQQQQQHESPEVNPIDGEPFAQPRLAKPPLGANAAYVTPAAARAAARAARAAAAANIPSGPSSNGKGNSTRTSGGTASNLAANNVAGTRITSEVDDSTSSSDGSSSSGGSSNGSPQAKLAQAREITGPAMKTSATSQDLHKGEIEVGELQADVLPAYSMKTEPSGTNSSSNGISNGSSSSSSNAATYEGTLSKARELMLSAMSSKATLKDLCSEELRDGELDDVPPIISLDDIGNSSGIKSDHGSGGSESAAMHSSSSSSSSNDESPIVMVQKLDDSSSSSSNRGNGDQGEFSRVSSSSSNSSSTHSSRRTRTKSHSTLVPTTNTSSSDQHHDTSSSSSSTASHDAVATSNCLTVNSASDLNSSAAAVMSSTDAAASATVTQSIPPQIVPPQQTSTAAAAADAGASRRRVRTAVNSSSSSSSSAIGAAAVQQLLAGQRDLAAAQRRAAAAGGSSSSKRKSSAVSSAVSSSSSNGRPGDVVYANGSWVTVGFEEDKQALQQLVPVLQFRLKSAVEAEQQHEEALIRSLYAKNNLRRLQKDGLVLLGLKAVPHDVLYSSLVWKFTPSSSTGAAAAAQGVLPYHRFRQGDSLLISQYSAEQAVTSFSNGQQGGSSRPGAAAGPDSIRPLDATVLEVRKEYLLLTVDKSDSDQLQRVITRSPAAAVAGWRLDQSVRDTTARRQLEAISRLAHMRQPNSPFELLLRSTIVGTPNGHYVATLPPMWVRDSSWRQDVRELLAGVQNLNTSQKRAIAQAITRSLTLWQGPPGTGKTRTLLALVEVLVKTALLQSNRWQAMGPLLACADTNAAVDNLVEGLVGKGLKVVRLGQPAKVRASLRHLTLEAQAEATPLGQKAAALREASKALFERAKKAADGSSLAWANSSSSSSALVPSTRSRRTSSAASSSSKSSSGVSVGQLDSESLEADAKRKWGQAEALSREASKLVLSQAHVVCATCAGSGDPMLADMHFNVVVIDEATQATEPATLVPLTQGAQCAVMAGDPCQLPPTIISRQAYAFDLDKTLFDRLQQEVGITPLLLDTQYRMNPAISAFPSRHFYGGKLQNGVSAAAKPSAAGVMWPVEGHPVMVVELQGLEEKAQKSGEKARNGSSAPALAPADVTAEVGLEDASYRNLPEARVALQALYALMKQGDATSGAILTPYKGQVRSLEHGLRVLAPWFTDMDVIVSSVDGYQGREADVIVFTAVRCNNSGKIGFVSDPRRLNVAITRPRRGLVVVCNPTTLARGSVDWSKFVSFAERQGYICGPQQLPVAPWQEEGLDPYSMHAAVAAADGSKSVVGTLSSAEEN